MTSPRSHLTRPGRLRNAIGVGLFALCACLPGAVGAEEPPAPTPTASPVTVATPAEEGLVEQLASDGDVRLVVGVTAATVLGLTGLALLDRRPEIPDHEAESFDQEPGNLS